MITPLPPLFLVQQQERTCSSLLELEATYQNSDIEMQLLEQCLSRTAENASKLAWASALIQETSVLLLNLPANVQVKLLKQPDVLPKKLRKYLSTVLHERDNVMIVKVLDVIVASKAMVAFTIPFLSSILANSSWEQLKNRLERLTTIDADEMPNGGDSSATLNVDRISSDDVQAFLSIYLFGNTNNAADPSKHYRGRVLQYSAARFITSKGCTGEVEGFVKGGKLTTRAWLAIGKAVARSFHGQGCMQQTANENGLQRLVLDESEVEWGDIEKSRVKDLLNLFPQRPGYLFTAESKRKFIELTHEVVRCLSALFSRPA